MQLMPSIFDLAISQGMKKFTIKEQQRCNDLYQTFLGILIKSLTRITYSFERTYDVKYLQLYIYYFSY